MAERVERQSLYGLATWLVSMGEPGSDWRRKVTLKEIIGEAEIALESSEAQDYERVEKERDAHADEADRLNAMAQAANKQRDELIEGIEAHLRAPGPSSDLPLHDHRDRVLYTLADRIKGRGASK